MDREARKLCLNENGPCVQQLRLLIYVRVKRPKSTVGTVRKEKSLVRNILWPEPRTLWAGLGGPRLPKRQGQL